MDYPRLWCGLFCSKFRWLDPAMPEMWSAGEVLEGATLPGRPCSSVHKLSIGEDQTKLPESKSPSAPLQHDPEDLLSLQDYQDSEPHRLSSEETNARRSLHLLSGLWARDCQDTPSQQAEMPSATAEAPSGERAISGISTWQGEKTSIQFHREQPKETAPVIGPAYVGL